MKQFENYGPKLLGLKTKPGKVVYPTNKITTIIEELKLIEASPNLWGDILAGGLMFLLITIISLGSLMGWTEITYEKKL